MNSTEVQRLDPCSTLCAEISGASKVATFDLHGSVPRPKYERSFKRMYP